MTATDTAPAVSATSGGPTPRRCRFWSASTSPTNRESRSPVAVALELPGCERLEPLVGADADPREIAEREVVGAEPLEVARDRPGEPEEAHGDDGRHQRQHRRMLGRARDQVAGARRQADAEQDGERSEPDRERSAAARGAGEREQPSERRRHARHLLGRAAGLEHDDPVRRPEKLEPVRDHEDAAAPVKPVERVGDEARRSPGRDRRSARRGSRAAPLGGARARARSVAARRTRASCRRRRPASRSHREAGSRRHRRPRAGLPRGRCSAEADPSPSRMLSAIVPRKSVGCCGTQATSSRQARGLHSARSTPPTVIRPARRLGQAEEEARDGALPGSALPDERDRLARRELEVEPVEHEPGARRVRERHALEPHRAPRRGSAEPVVPSARTAGGRLEQLEDPLAAASPSALAWNCAPSWRNGR